MATRPLLPTRKIVEKFDQARQAAVTLLEFKKQTEKLEAELKSGGMSRRNSSLEP